jgi:hypothetical protein
MCPKCPGQTVMRLRVYFHPEARQTIVMMLGACLTRFARGAGSHPQIVEAARGIGADRLVDVGT